MGYIESQLLPNERIVAPTTRNKIVLVLPMLFAAVFAALTIGSVTACSSSGQNRDLSRYEVTATFPHDSSAYTQGLVWADSVLFESTGLNGQSSVRRVDLRSGRVLASRPLAADRFGEGLALLHGRLYHLNELEYVNGELLANVYESNWVLRVDPATGDVREAIDFSDLYHDRPPYAAVMNGIALAPDGKQLLLTGKYWPVMYQVRLRAEQTARS